MRKSFSAVATCLRLLLLVLVSSSWTASAQFSITAGTFNSGGGYKGLGPGHPYDFTAVINDINSNLAFVDVLAVQELNQSSSAHFCEDQFALMKDGIGVNFPPNFARFAPNNFPNDVFCSWGSFPRVIGNAIFSKYPVLESWIVTLQPNGSDLRNALGARISFPTGQAIVYSTQFSHTSSSGDPAAARAARTAQSQDLLTDILTQLGKPGQANYPIIVLGDFNSRMDSPLDTASLRVYFNNPLVLHDLNRNRRASDNLILDVIEGTPPVGGVGPPDEVIDFWFVTPMPSPAANSNYWIDLSTSSDHKPWVLYLNYNGPSDWDGLVWDNGNWE